MLLSNFEIISDIELRSGGLIWELHNFADFEGLELQRAENAVVMTWSVPRVTNPWGDVGNKASGMKLRFVGLKFLNVGPRDPEMPMSEDDCLAALYKVNTQDQETERWPRQLKGDEFRLLFEFQSGRRIEIESHSVELIAAP